jgi:cation:H+ antiporter
VLGAGGDCAAARRRGALLLVGAGQLIVIAAKGIGATLGWDEFVVGATLVALGTSTPELASTIISRVRGHDELGLNTLFGSTISNNLWIVAVATVLSPARLELSEAMVGVVAGLGVTLLVLPTGPVLSRRRGVLLLATYVGYVAVLIGSS